MIKKTVLSTRANHSVSCCHDNSFGVNFILCPIVDSKEFTLLAHQYSYSGQGETISGDRFSIPLGTATKVTIEDVYKFSPIKGTSNIKLFHVNYVNEGGVHNYYFELDNTDLHKIEWQQFEEKKAIALS